MSSEWAILQSLRGYRTRLVNRSHYQPLDTAEAQEERHKIAHDRDFYSLQNELDLFEIGFREILMRNDLDLFMNEPDNIEIQEAQFLLSPLCQELEGMVNLAMLGSSLSRESSLANHGQNYQNLDSLIKRLKISKWIKFSVITGTNQTLFRAQLPLSTVQKARHSVDAFNNYMNKFTRLPSREVRSWMDHDLLKACTSTPTQDHTFTYLQSITALLGKLKTLPKTKCVRGHHVLIQLANWEDNISVEPISTQCVTNFNLFLSTCENENISWQECQLGPRNPLNRNWKSKSIEGICQEILDAKIRELAVRLASWEDDILIVGDDTFGPVKSSLQNKGKRTTLRDFLGQHRFQPKGQVIGLRGIRFDDTDKHSLAIKLVSSLILSLDSGQIPKCWDPTAVHFPSEPNGECQPNHPYALSVLEQDINDTIGDPDNADISFLKLERFIFPRLAKLLLEIKLGQIRDDIQVNLESNDPDTLTLEDLITEVGEADLSLMPFLDAVDICRRFPERFVELKQSVRLTNSEDRGSITESTIRRSICTEVVRLIKETGQSHNEHTPWVISSNPNELGFYKGPPDGLSPNLPLRHEPLAKKKRELDSDNYGPTRLKRVAFADNPNQTVGFVHEIRGTLGNPEHTKSFFKLMDDFRISYHNYIREMNNLSIVSNIRIAILDTGIDMAHPSVSDALFDHKLSKDRCYNWTCTTSGGDLENTQDVADSNGHGTNVAKLLIETAPDAELYIAKVMESSSIKMKEVRSIAKAIDFAVDKDHWDVDIVVMSFGIHMNARGDSSKELLSNYRAEISEVIERNPNKIFIAAAGNNGSNEGRSFPAMMSTTSPNVICMHASNGIGKDGGISPSAMNEQNDNFMTLGMDIEFNTLYGEGEQGKTVCKSGTSWATPIAAGIAANILQITDRMDLDEKTKKRLRKGSVMKDIFLKMSDGGHGTYRFMAPWVKLWKAGWEEDVAMIANIKAQICDAAKV